MIRNESEYQEATRRQREELERLEQHRARLVDAGLNAQEVGRARAPQRALHQQHAEEIESYERLRRGDLGELVNLHGLGRTLIALRIARGLTQRELAEKLGVHESQVSRDERNEYHGITVERAARVLDAMGVELRSRFMEPVLPPGETAA
jgi:DNA-directed RNA polymerase specialized sigma subunit